MLRQFDQNSFTKINPEEETQSLMISQKSRTETIVYDNYFEGPVSYMKTLHFMIANEFLRREVQDVVIYEHANHEHLWDADFAAFLATAQFKNRSLKRRQFRHVEVKVEPNRDGEGMPYKVLHPDCVHEGKHRGVFFKLSEAAREESPAIVQISDKIHVGVRNTEMFGHPHDKHRGEQRAAGVFVHMPGFLGAQSQQTTTWRKNVIQWVLETCINNVYSNCIDNTEIQPRCIIIEDAQTLFHALGSEQNILDCVKNLESLISDGDHPIETQALFNNIIIGRKLDLPGDS